MHKFVKLNRPSVVCLFVAWAVFAAGPRLVVHSHEEFGDQTVTDTRAAFARHLALFHPEPRQEPGFDWHLHWVFNPLAGMVGQDGILSISSLQTPAFKSSDDPLSFHVGLRKELHSLDSWCVVEGGDDCEVLDRLRGFHRGLHFTSSSRVSLLEILCVCRC